MKKLITLISLVISSTSVQAMLVAGSQNIGAVWMVGDSIMQSNLDGNDSSSPRKSLYDKLNAGGYSFTYTGSSNTNPDGLSGNNYIWHTGYSRSMITNPTNLDGRYGHQQSLNTAWSSNQLASVKPNLIIIMLGTNDIEQMSRVPGSTPATIANTLQTLATNMFQLANASGVTPTMFITTIAPNYTNPQDPANTQAFNALLPGVVNNLVAAGRDAKFVDIYNPLFNNYATAMNSDQLHPNATGNDLIATQWYNQIQSIVVPEPTSMLLAGVSMLGLLRRKRD